MTGKWTLSPRNKRRDSPRKSTDFRVEEEEKKIWVALEKRNVGQKTLKRLSHLAVDKKEE